MAKPPSVAGAIVSQPESTGGPSIGSAQLKPPSALVSDQAMRIVLVALSLLNSG